MQLKEEPKKLFYKFSPVSDQEWEQKILEDLQGADYEKKLIWNTPEGIKVKPFYRAQDLEYIPGKDSLPGTYPYLRGLRPYSNQWKIRQDIDETNIEEANRIACDSLMRGADALQLDVSAITHTNQLARLLLDIDPTKTDIRYHSARNYKVLMNRLISICNDRGLDPNSLLGSFDFDPINYLLLNGDFYQSQESDLLDACDLIESFGTTAPLLRLISINGQTFHNAGANIVQELAFAMASASDYVARLIAADLPANHIMPRITFVFASGSNYFMEIAKFRAARLLWARIAEQYHPLRKPESVKAHIQVITSSWNKTVYDPYVNMLRTTTEAMAAAIGGVDSITVLPFDMPYKDSDEFSRRMARNQQIILKEEAFLDKVIDPSGGSYYIENLTSSIASHAWDLFRQIEQMGGMIEAVKAGFIQESVEKNYQARMNDVSNRKMILLGTNQHPNLSESMLGQIQELDEVVSPDEKEEKQTKYKRISTHRAAEVFEDLRLSTELYVSAGNPQPVVFLLTIGNLAMRKARASFSSSFFGCAGYHIIDNPGFNSIEEGVNAAIESQADIVVLCSSDEEYVDLVRPFCSLLKSQDPQLILVLAGYPKDHIESFRQSGIDEFIHIRSNVVETLSKFHKRLMINE